LGRISPEKNQHVALEAGFLALAAGTPVIAFRSGALPGIVEHGVTGFMVDNLEEMSEAIHQAHTIRPAVCRAAAAERFSKAHMVEHYFRLYREMTELPRGVSRYRLRVAHSVRIP
jgi:glycosyltransferase involved in cell wall biosynthesis